MYLQTSNFGSFTKVWDQSSGILPPQTRKHLEIGGTTHIPPLEMRISSTMLGRAVILTTHSMEECEALCSRFLDWLLPKWPKFLFAKKGAFRMCWFLLGCWRGDFKGVHVNKMLQKWIDMALLVLNVLRCQNFCSCLVLIDCWKDCKLPEQQALCVFFFLLILPSSSIHRFIEVENHYLLDRFPLRAWVR